METETLIDNFHNKHPLAGFSIYTEFQSNAVRNLGQEILNSMNGCILPEDNSGNQCVSAEQVNRVYDQFWFWVLGAFEVVRTMHQSRNCFVQSLIEQLDDLKRTLALVRVPFAKQELPEKKKSPVRGEPSIHGINTSPPDLEFEIKGQIVSVRRLISQFETVFDGITRADVLSDHRRNYR